MKQDFNQCTRDGEELQKGIEDIVNKTEFDIIEHTSRSSASAFSTQHAARNTHRAAHITQHAARSAQRVARSTQ